MPSILKNAQDPILIVREPHDDELYVMYEFERHTSHCSQCSYYLRTHKEGCSICDRGEKYAVDVASYLYSKNGRAHSVIAREHKKPMLVNIPSNRRAVQELLLAIEEGLRLPRKHRDSAPIISYDRTYEVAPRRPRHRHVTHHEIIERDPPARKRRHYTICPTTRDYSSRGSLYDSDTMDRIERTHSTRVYRPSTYYR